MRAPVAVTIAVSGAIILKENRSNCELNLPEKRVLDINMLFGYLGFLQSKPSYERKNQNVHCRYDQ
jgi:hypothetical protein